MSHQEAFSKLCDVINKLSDILADDQKEIRELSDTVHMYQTKYMELKKKDKRKKDDDDSDSDARTIFYAEHEEEDRHEWLAKPIDKKKSPH